tara:strand:- start:259 stop:2181 length:1923 start_codon:yes stop_codon:yes gene_type:complete
MEYIPKIKTQLLNFLKDSKKEILVQILKITANSYYNTDNILITDEEYDTIYDKLKEIDPKNSYFDKVGHSINTYDKKIELPYWMGSMNKKKTEDEVIKWYKKYPGEVIISDKLDGKSFLLEITNKTKKLYSRGNGIEGKDISYILDYISIPDCQNVIKSHEEIFIRGEILISKNNFKKIKSEYANTRSFIAGITNLKKVNDDNKHNLKFIDLVCFEIISPEMKTEEQFQKLIDLGFKTVNNKKLDSLNYEELKNTLIERREKSEYDIDGIIVCQNKLHQRNLDKNPKYAIAFKLDKEFAITNVKDIKWNLSKHGRLKPTVIIESVFLNNSNIDAVTGNNANFIVKNKIGIGAKLKIIKSGEIIPKIVEVLEGKEPLMPDCDYKWNSTKKEILMLNVENNDEFKIKRITNFFKTIGVEHIGPGIFKKMFQHKINTINKILDVRKEELLLIPGIKEKSSDNIIKNINKILNFPIKMENIVAGSCILESGLGIKILEKILNKYPTIFTDNSKLKIEDLISIPSIEEKTATKFLNKLDEIRIFFKNHPRLKYDSFDSKKKKIIKKINKIDNKIHDKHFVITGKRDKTLIKMIEEKGGIIQTILNKKTDILITDDLESNSSKIQKAKQLNIMILDINEFKKIYIT